MVFGFPDHLISFWCKNWKTSFFVRFFSWCQLISAVCLHFLTRKQIPFYREVADLRNVGKFLQKFFENQRLFQWLFVKRTKISDKNLNIWNFSDFLKKLKIFVNKNTIKMKNIKMYPLSTTFFSDISATFWKIPAKMKMPTTSLVLAKWSLHYRFTLTHGIATVSYLFQFLEKVIKRIVPVIKRWHR